MTDSILDALTQSRDAEAKGKYLVAALYAQDVIDRATAERDRLHDMHRAQRGAAKALRERGR